MPENSYDIESYRLAEHFLQGVCATENDTASLARRIQEAVDDWFTGYNPKVGDRDAR